VTLFWPITEDVQVALSTELNGLAAGSASALSPAIDNRQRFLYANFELVLAAQPAARVSGAFVSLHLIGSLDGTNFADVAGDDAAELLTTFKLDGGTSAARRLLRITVPVPPLAFRLYVRNGTGAAFAASGNQLRYARFFQAWRSP